MKRRYVREKYEEKCRIHYFYAFNIPVPSWTSGEIETFATHRKDQFRLQE